jgi:DnaJ-class molecular chaperone
MAACPKCSGTGVVECHRCRGTGNVQESNGEALTNLAQGAEPHPVKCPSCHGVGTEACSRCDGSGEVHC